MRRMARLKSDSKVNKNQNEDWQRIKQFRQQNSLFRQLSHFLAKRGLFFAKWGLLFASLYVRKSPAVLLDLGDPIALLHHCLFRQPNCTAGTQCMTDSCCRVKRR